MFVLVAAVLLLYNRAVSGIWAIKKMEVVFQFGKGGRRGENPYEKEKTVYVFFLLP